MADLGKVEDPIDACLAQIDSVFCLHAYCEICPIPGGDMPSNRKLCKERKQQLEQRMQIFLNGERDAIACALSLREVLVELPRLCPLRKDLVATLEWCGEQIANVDVFDSFEDQYRPAVACSLHLRQGRS